MTSISSRIRDTGQRALDGIPAPVRRAISVPPVHGLVIAAVCLLLLGRWGAISSNGYVLQLICAYVVATLGLNITTGYAGALSLGQGASFAVGAYVVAILASDHSWPVWLTLPAALVVGVLIGVLMGVPAGRLGDIGLAMVSLGAVLVVSDMLVQFRSVTGGNDGVSGIVARWGFDPTDPGSPGLVGVLVVLVAYLSYCAHAAYRVTRFGRATAAVRDEPIGASALGISGYVTKVAAFAAGAGLGALSGGLFSYVSAYISPDAFSANLSILFLVMVVLGGSGSAFGPIVGAVLLVLVPLHLDQYPHVNVIVYGVLLIVLVRLRPRGLISRTAAPAARAVQDIATAPAAAPAEREVGAPVLQVRELRRSFGGVDALRGVSFDVGRGEVLGLVGPNGSGKTTVLNVICGHYRPSGGTISWRGTSLGGMRPPAIAALGVARTFQTPKTFAGMSIEEHIALASRDADDPELTRACRVAARRFLENGGIDLSRRRDRERESRTLSHGQLRFLEAATAVSGCPGLLLLDEPAAGLSAAEIEGFESVVGDLAAAGVASIVVEHHLDLISRLADRVVVLDVGSVIWQGGPTGLHEDAAVRAAYLGVS